MKLLLSQKLISLAVVFVALWIIPEEWPWEKDKSGEKTPKEKLTFFHILKKIGTSFVSTIKFNWLLLAILIAFLCVFSTIRVASGSMETTLMTGDRGIIINSVLGYKPVRGEIVCFPSGDEIWIKRVIGLPGETVRIYDGKVYVNGMLLDEDYLQPGILTDSGTAEEYIVPEDSIFVMGDNRGRSFDSRYWDYPYVPVSEVVGKYKVTFYHKK